MWECHLVPVLGRLIDRIQTMHHISVNVVIKQIKKSFPKLAKPSVVLTELFFAAGADGILVEHP